jgi:hypothetical protein
MEIRVIRRSPSEKKVKRCNNKKKVKGKKWQV